MPIVLAAVPSGPSAIAAVSACTAGSVCGDHCSPISDTTIMASAGAQCNHVNHVSTQLPYALLVAGISFIGYILVGFINDWRIVLPITIGILLLSLQFLRFVVRVSRK